MMAKPVGPTRNLKERSNENSCLHQNLVKIVIGLFGLIKLHTFILRYEIIPKNKHVFQLFETRYICKNR